MKNRLLLLAGVMFLGTGCNANKGSDENAGMDAAAAEMLAEEPSATDQAETTTTTTDSVEVMLADSARKQQ